MPDSTTETAPAVRRPDAVKIPMSHPTRPSFKGRRFDFIFDEAERILGADPTRGEKAGRRSQINENVYFFSLDHAALLLFPTGHRLDGQPRYHWVRQGDGCIYGYLVDAAKAELEANPPEPSRGLSDVPGAHVASDRIVRDVGCL